MVSSDNRGNGTNKVNGASKNVNMYDKVIVNVLNIVR